MRGFKEAAEFIGQWIKVQKHAATVLISQSYFHYRISQMICRLSLKELVWSVSSNGLINPETAFAPPISIYLLQLEENESDYLVTFMLNLL